MFTLKNLAGKGFQLMDDHSMDDLWRYMIE